jgi:hypothetical protein
MKYLLLFIFSFYLFGDSGYEVFEKKDNYGDHLPYTKVYGIDESIEVRYHDWNHDGDNKSKTFILSKVL